MGTVKVKEAEQEQGRVPEQLVYEIIDGKPIYYKGYKEVLAKNKTLEEIMGSGVLQGIIIQYLLGILYQSIDRGKYHLLTNEIGSHLDKRNNLSNDIAVYDKTVLTPDKVTAHHPDVPAELVIEVDVDAELEEWSDIEYIQLKTQKMLDFGVKKVLWITTKTRKVMVATPNENWQIIDWAKDIELIPGTTFNIAAYLKEEGIELE